MWHWGVGEVPRSLRFIVAVFCVCKLYPVAVGAEEFCPD